ncbi:caspase family protein [Desulfobacterales bacterium HSG16]|nr:caspase family protein [Desulfobacterales bacterium HSG16]
MVSLLNNEQKKYYKMALNALSRDDYYNATQYMQKASKLGHPDAIEWISKEKPIEKIESERLYKLGLSYSDGNYVGSLALPKMREAAKLGNAKAKEWLQKYEAEKLGRSNSKGLLKRYKAEDSNSVNSLPVGLVLALILMILSFTLYGPIKKVYNKKDDSIQKTSEFDKKPPEIIIIEPNLSRGIKRKNADNVILIKGIAKDESRIDKVSINEKEIGFSDNGNFETKIALVKGENSILIRAIDIKSNSAEKTITIFREPDIDKRLALVISNSNYINGRLKNPVNDANDMSAMLENLGFSVMKFINCNQKTMKKVIDEFGIKLKDYNVAMFFYAGHGVQVSGNNYLIPVDAKLDNENDVEYDCVRADRILAKMENAGSKTNIVILDACRDNPFERSWRRGGKGSGLAFMNAPSGSFIAYATSPGNTASDGSGKNGLYTSALLKYINMPNIKIEEVFKKVRGTVIEKSNSRQIPWESTSLIGDFYLNKQ